MTTMERLHRKGVLRSAEDRPRVHLSARSAPARSSNRGWSRAPSAAAVEATARGRSCPVFVDEVSRHDERLLDELERLVQREAAAAGGAMRFWFLAARCHHVQLRALHDGRLGAGRPGSPRPWRGASSATHRRSRAALLFRLRMPPAAVGLHRGVRHLAADLSRLRAARTEEGLAHDARRPRGRRDRLVRAPALSAPSTPGIRRASSAVSGSRAAAGWKASTRRCRSSRSTSSFRPSRSSA